MRLDDKKLLIERLTRWGYLHDYEDGRDVSFEELERAIVEYQRFNAAPIDEISKRIHGRVSRSDGSLGPATLAVMNARTCDVPDPVLGRGVEEANWPEPCRNQITVSWNFPSVPGLSVPQTAGIWAAVKEEYERLFQLGLLLNPGAYPDTRIYAALRALPGSTLAWSYLANNNCSARLQQAYDSTIQWTVPLALGTWKHEVGHALGMNHTPNDRNSLMYPSMNGQTGLNETDIQQMLRIGYKRRTTPPDPDPDPDPGSNVSVLITVGDEVYKHKWKSSDATQKPNFDPF